jgi:hypothetical protein
MKEILMARRSNSDPPAPFRTRGGKEKRANKALTMKERIKRMEELGMEVVDDDECGFIVIVGAPPPARKS